MFFKMEIFLGIFICWIFGLSFRVCVVRISCLFMLVEVGWLGLVR